MPFHALRRRLSRSRFGAALGWPALAAAVFALLALRLSTWEVPAMREELGAAQVALQQAGSAVRVPLTPVGERDGMALDEASSPNRVPTLLADLAKQHHVAVLDAAYATALRGGLEATDIDLRLQGSYAGIRQLVSGMVSGQRGVALQSLAVRRERSAEGAGGVMTAEVKLVFYRRAAL